MLETKTDKNYCFVCSKTGPQLDENSFNNLREISLLIMIRLKYYDH